MSRGGRKGRVSNELVAASCAAILVVYAAGYWRTRDEARRMGTQSQVRRPAPAAPAAQRPATAQVPAVVSPRAGAEVPPGTENATQASVPVPVPVPAKSTGPAGPVAAPDVPAAQPAVVAATIEPPAETAPPVVEPPAPIPGVWHDGTYTGWGQSFHGDIEARVTIRNGEIVNVGIATCATRYPCYVIDSIILQPIERQSPEVDRVSRATESTDAYYWGLVQALEKAEIGPAAQAAGRP